MGKLSSLLIALCFCSQVVLGGSEDSFKVGALLCQTGNCADWGTAALRGALLAKEELNSSGGVLSKKIELVVEDTAESISGARAVTAYQSLIARKLHYIIGPSWSPGALAIAPIAANHGDVLLITPSASAREFSRAADNIFSVRPVEDASTRALAKYAFRQGKRKAAIFSSQQPAESTQGRIFEDEFIKLGGSITVRLESDPSLHDLKTEALKIVASKPDIVFLMNYNQLETGARALKMLGYSGMRMAISLNDARIADAGSLLDGLYVGRAAEPSDAFKAAFLKRFGEAAGLSAEGGYDALKIIAKAIEEANTFDVSEVKQKLRSGNYAGAIGAFSFTDNREVVQDPVIRVAKAGKLVALDEGK